MILPWPHLKLAEAEAVFLEAFRATGAMNRNFVDHLERQFPSLAPGRCAAVGIPVNQQCRTLRLQVGRKMYGGRGFSYPTLEAGNGDDHSPGLY